MTWGWFQLAVGKLDLLEHRQSNDMVGFSQLLNAHVWAIHVIP